MSTTARLNNPDFDDPVFEPVNQWQSDGPTPRCGTFVEQFILPWETVYAKGHYGDDRYVLTEHDKDDPGGTTRYGIDQRSHPNVDVEHLTRPRSITIFGEEWNAAECQMMPAKMGEVYFNCRVNCGIGRAQKIRLITGLHPSAFLTEQVEFYKRLITAKPSSQKYLGGWLNRVNALRTYLKV